VLKNNQATSLSVRELAQQRTKWGFKYS